MIAASRSAEPDLDRIRARYRHFAEVEAHGISPLYEELARTVAGSGELLRFLAGLPPEKQQPNLLFAAVQRLYGPPAGGDHFLDLVVHHGTTIRQVMLSRRTQTNEPGRCAVLLPALARLPAPLALLEVGASAGLCLLPDFWAYDYGRRRLDALRVGRRQPPIFPCEVNDAAPLPEKVPEIVWRPGLDINPLNVSNEDDTRWLEALVWPGEGNRLGRLRAAIETAREHPPRVLQGDLLANLSRTAASAPRHATLVIFHTAVLVYLTPEQRDRFTAQVAHLGAAWISYESPDVMPSVAARLNVERDERSLLLALNGHPVAFAGPHGQWLNWIG